MNNQYHGDARNYVSNATTEELSAWSYKKCCKEEFVPRLEIQVTAASILHRPIHLQIKLCKAVCCPVWRKGHALEKAADSLTLSIHPLQEDAAKLPTNQYYCRQFKSNLTELVLNFDEKHNCNLYSPCGPQKNFYFDFSATSETLRMPQSFLHK